MSDKGTVKIISGLVGLTHSPKVSEGKLSSTGKTISTSGYASDKSVRLDASKIMEGETVFRDRVYYELHTEESAERRANTSGDIQFA